MSQPLPLSGVVITRNEADRIARCVGSMVGLCSEVIVLDSGSTDDTVRIAHQLGANQARLDMLAAAYVVLRAIYIAVYIKGIGSVRSAVWALGFVVNIAILFIAR